MRNNLLTTCDLFLRRPGRGRKQGNCKTLIEAGCEHVNGMPTVAGVEALQTKLLEEAGAYWSFDIIRLANGGRLDLPHSDKIGIALVCHRPLYTCTLREELEDLEYYCDCEDEYTCDSADLAETRDVVIEDIADSLNDPDWQEYWSYRGTSDPNGHAVQWRDGCGAYATQEDAEAAYHASMARRERWLPSRESAISAATEALKTDYRYTELSENETLRV